MLKTYYVRRVSIGKRARSYSKLLVLYYAVVVAYFFNTRTRVLKSLEMNRSLGALTYCLKLSLPR